jgi:endonuclease YncB( thermonuclease family)
MSISAYPRWAIIPLGSVLALGIFAGAGIAPSLRGERHHPPPAPRTVEERSARETIVGAYAAEVLRVIDGDTFEARVRAWPGIDITTKIRLRGIDAPELRARCPEERAKAEAARDALAAMLRGLEVTISRVGLDKYGGRIDADAATARTPDISAAILAAGLARPYRGGRRESWCGGA